MSEFEKTLIGQFNFGIQVKRSKTARAGKMPTKKQRLEDSALVGVPMIPFFSLAVLTLSLDQAEKMHADPRTH